MPGLLKASHLRQRQLLRPHRLTPPQPRHATATHLGPHSWEWLQGRSTNSLPQPGPPSQSTLLRGMPETPRPTETLPRPTPPVLPCRHSTRITPGLHSFHRLLGILRTPATHRLLCPRQSLLAFLRVFLLLCQAWEPLLPHLSLHTAPLNAPANLMTPQGTRVRGQAPPSDMPSHDRGRLPRWPHTTPTLLLTTYPSHTALPTAAAGEDWAVTAGPGTRMALHGTTRPETTLGTGMAGVQAGRCRVETTRTTRLECAAASLKKATANLGTSADLPTPRRNFDSVTSTPRRFVGSMPTWTTFTHQKGHCSRAH
mmetsp:Transcript_17649/g.51619  ORF Transcript_17649/g.51619 Transcript_17649/m.51619 type:complete len:312 (-) Transcript_17649:320-1255(-)